MRGVPDGTRDQATGELVYADDLIPAALCHELDKLEWHVPLPINLTKPKDSMPEWDRNF